MASEIAVWLLELVAAKIVSQSSVCIDSLAIVYLYIWSVKAIQNLMSQILKTYLV